MYANERPPQKLTQQVLPALGVGDMLEDRQDEIVTHQTFGGGEEAQIAHDDMSLGVAKAIASPDFNVLCHRNFGRHPVVRTTVGVVLPSQ